MKKLILLCLGLLAVACQCPKNDAGSTAGTVKKGLRVVCLGNSITKHGYAQEIDWFCDWGMAASKEENDYCHVLQRMLRQRYQDSTIVVDPVNVAVHFERNPECNVDSLLGKYCEGADYIVIRLGENVRSENHAAFRDNLPGFIKVCRKYTPNVIVTGLFWADKEKDRALLDAAIGADAPYIPLHWIVDDAKDLAYPKLGDTFYDTTGKPYTLQKDIIATHPNDFGMKLIAEAIYNVIVQ